jgi:hypothetical protein
MEHSSEVLAVGDWQAELLVVELAEHSPVGRREPEKRIEGLLDQEFASLQSVEFAQVSVAASAEADIGCKVRLVAGVQGCLGWLRKLSYYRTVDTVVEELHTRHRSIADGHKPPVGCCQCKSSQQYQLQLDRWTLSTGTLSRLAFVEEDCIHQWYADCMYSKDVLRAYGHNIVQP